MKPRAQLSVRAAVILAGGEGSRLRDLTRKIAGHPTPKQFCAVVGDDCLLEQTRRRIAISVADQHILTVVNRSHERFYRAPLANLPRAQLVVQPQGRGTATAIVYALMRAARIASTVSMAIFPADHYVDNDAAFMRHVDAAFEAVEQRSELTVLLGISPDRPEAGYGWIEPAQPVRLARAQLFTVRRFWEKPPQSIAQRLMSSGCLWNSFVMVGRVSTLLRLVITAQPLLYSSFAALRPVLDTELEEPSMETMYARLAPVDFSSDILAKAPVNLTVLPVKGVDWSDLGEPARVMDTLARVGTRPRWAAA
jgi:mannose-1-phosphate guanylyltransferase